jgi:hypothetical protein
MISPQRTHIIHSRLVPDPRHRPSDRPPRRRGEQCDATTTGHLAILLACLTLLGASAAARSAQPRPLGPDQRLDRLRHRVQAAGAQATAAATLDNFKLVGHSALDGFGDYGDLFAHGNFAYVGSRCGEGAQGGDGVQVVDIANPRHPRLVSKLVNPAFTRAEDVTVRAVRTPSFAGVLAVVGIQACFGSGHEAEVVPGLEFFDVTHPRQPVLLSHWDLPQGTIGCHEIDAVQRPNGQVLAVCARNLVDHLNSGGADAIHLVDATNPANPRTITDWSLNLDPEGGVGCLPFQFAHSARFEHRGASLYVSYWDAGTVHLDITTPSAPVVVSRTRIVPPDEDGDNHSMTLARGGRVMVINPEDFSPVDCPTSRVTRVHRPLVMLDLVVTAPERMRTSSAMSVLCGCRWRRPARGRAGRGGRRSAAQGMS